MKQRTFGGYLAGTFMSGCLLVAANARGQRAAPTMTWVQRGEVRRKLWA